MLQLASHIILSGFRSNTADDDTMETNTSNTFQYYDIESRRVEEDTNVKPYIIFGCSCTLLLSVVVIAINMSALILVADDTSDRVTQILTIIAIIVIILLAYATIFRRKKCLIACLTFYGLLWFIILSRFTSHSNKVNGIMIY